MGGGKTGISARFYGFRITAPPRWSSIGSVSWGIAHIFPSPIGRVDWWKTDGEDLTAFQTAASQIYARRECRSIYL
jgi:hypothetical protein